MKSTSALYPNRSVLAGLIAASLGLCNFAIAPALVPPATPPSGSEIHSCLASLEESDTNPSVKGAHAIAQSASERSGETPSYEIGTVYRFTKNGWEDSSKWRHANQPVPQHLDAIHPVIWSLIVLGLALMVLIGSSKSAEVDELLASFDQWLTHLTPTRSKSEDR